MLVRARAPLRISFAGGGTDVSPYAEEHGGVVLNVTMDKYAYVSLEVKQGPCFTMHDLDDGIEVKGNVVEEIAYDGTLDLAKAVVRRLGVSQGFDLWLHSDAPWGSGLGSSSTHVVAVLSAFARWMQLSMGLYDLAEMAYQIERIDLRQAGGRQDQYAATFGGFNFMEFSADGALINPLRISNDVLNELNYRMLLCFLGRTRQSSAILKDQVERYRSGVQDSLNALHQTKRLAYDMKRALLKGQIDLMGELLDQGWTLKKNFSTLISSPQIDETCEEARRQGALGGKLLGAGGGGHMLLLCPRVGKHKIVDCLTNMGAKAVPFSFELQGAATWQSPDSQ